jgi:hypothetical protein
MAPNRIALCCASALMFACSAPSSSSPTEESAAADTTSVLLDPSVYNYLFYISHNADLANYSQTQASDHWLNHGIAEGRQAALLFSVTEYLYENSDLTAQHYSNTNAILHYVASGHAAGRPSLYVLDPYVFDQTYYVAANPRLQGQTADTVKTDWVNYGIVAEKQASPIFKVGEYLAENSDLFDYSGVQGVQHFVLHGRAEGRGTLYLLDTEVFDLAYYLANNSDLANYSETEAKTHWILYGIGEGRRGSLLFSANEYSQENPDLAQDGLGTYGTGNKALILHYVEKGRAEGRTPLLNLDSQVFDWQYYTTRYTDLASYTEPQARAHWLAYGIPEGRSGTAIPTAVHDVTTLGFGVVGDGVTDVYNGIHEAIDWLNGKGGGTLSFPAGTYRIGRGTGRTGTNGAIELVNVSKIRIRFDGGATLSLDNLNSSLAGDECHGIYIAGNSSYLDLKNVSVAWAKTPSTRSQGDGVYVIGPTLPNQAQAPRFLQFDNVSISSAPQAGAFIAGAGNVIVRRMNVKNTLADGLHFNSNYSGIWVKGYTAENNGDDSLAFVTYYDPTCQAALGANQGTASYNPCYGYFGGQGPLNSPDITARNNNDAAVQYVSATGKLPTESGANGVRISGSQGVNLSNVAFSKYIGASVKIDSALVGPGAGWAYLPSKNVSIVDMSSAGSNYGLVSQTANGSGSVFSANLARVRFSSTVFLDVWLPGVSGVTLTHVIYSH